MAKIIKQVNYLKAGVNVFNGDIIQLLTEGRLSELKSPDGKVKKVNQFEVKLPDGETKLYTMNNTTIDNLTLAFGDDSVNWVNKSLKVHLVKQMSFGKLTDILILTPSDWTEPTPPKQASAQQDDEPSEN